jgi:hypothetical protein
VERTYQHEAVGNVLEALYGEQTEQVAVQMARHFELCRQVYTGDTAPTGGMRPTYTLHYSRCASQTIATSSLVALPGLLRVPD